MLLKINTLTEDRKIVIYIVNNKCRKIIAKLRKSDNQILIAIDYRENV